MRESFEARKRKILQELNKPDDEYVDASPKGSVDNQIRDLVDRINAIPGCVTTSSCAGRIAVFVDGGISSAPLAAQIASKPAAERTEKASIIPPADSISDSHQEAMTSKGGKGRGGHWLFVSHDPVTAGNSSLFSMFGLSTPQTPIKAFARSQQGTPRLVHFKFEPLILHILTDSLATAHALVSAAMQAGYRESGVTSIASPHPMVAIRTNGLALESVVGFVSYPSSSVDQQKTKVAHDQENKVCDNEAGETIVACVSGEYLSLLLTVANQRFILNDARRERLQDALERVFASTGNGLPTETKEQRRERKRREGLRKREELKVARLEEDMELISREEAQHQ